MENINFVVFGLHQLGFELSISITVIHVCTFLFHWVKYFFYFTEKGVGMIRAEIGLKNRQIINETYSQGLRLAVAQSQMRVTFVLGDI